MSISEPITSFTLFPKLSVELQLMVWERVPIESQVVTIRSQQAIVGVVVIDNESNIIEDHRGLKTAAYARYKILPLLHTNQQSRGVAQSHTHLVSLTVSAVYRFTSIQRKIRFTSRTRMLSIPSQICTSIRLRAYGSPG